MSEDLPALGKPTSATSATVFSSSTTSADWPGSPSSAKPGALRLVDARAALPRPPPPSGPPSGLNFSRWMDEQPGPPSPAATCSTTRSTNTRSPLQGERAGPRRGPPSRKLLALLGGDHADDATAALAAERHRARRER